ncbi:hypothetical protein AGMMS50239_38680 [Bacteroidia bacterium]|nr:hypothetical protein AGMMS50239_38680 [Bacteroidia bacterium]
MAIYIKTKIDLVEEIIKKIDSNIISTWSYDEDNDFTYEADQWCNRAWMSEKGNDNAAYTFGIIGRRDRPIKTTEYAIFHSRFAEMLLEHFDHDIEDIRITSMPVLEIDIINP